jgi:NADH-quinone oxidoreductase subunit L
MFFAFEGLGTLNYAGIVSASPSLATTTATVIAAMLFVGAIGKSAQLPLFVWLPDAMAGPTPVSALIHAATMVTAGVYLMTRMNPVIALAADWIPWLIAIVGALTALFAATVAVAQSDIKKVLAYSTVSQLGYMFLAVGSGAYVAAIFHMVTHAFFKALLFLGSGSVIHGMDDEQDMRRMGALRKVMPITAVTFIIGWLAIAGVFPFAGFWSKDEILLYAWAKSPVLWAVGWVTAILTAFYMSRQVFLVFFGPERWKQEEALSSEEAAELPEHEPAATTGHTDAEHADAGHAAEPHESPWTMTLPLIVLAAGAALGGLLNLPLSKKTEFLGRWLEPVFGSRVHELTASSGTKWALFFVTAAAVAVGIGIAARLFLGRQPQPDALEPELLKNGWYVDNLYAALIEAPGRMVSAWLAYVFDLKVVDGAVNGVGAVVRASGSRLRAVQSGYVRNYALAVVVGAVVLLAYGITRVAV